MSDLQTAQRKVLPNYSLLKTECCNTVRWWNGDSLCPKPLLMKQPLYQVVLTSNNQFEKKKTQKTSVLCYGKSNYVMWQLIEFHLQCQLPHFDLLYQSFLLLLPFHAVCQKMVQKVCHAWVNERHSTMCFCMLQLVSYFPCRFSPSCVKHSLCKRQSLGECCL